MQKLFYHSTINRKLIMKFKSINQDSYERQEGMKRYISNDTSDINKNQNMIAYYEKVSRGLEELDEYAIEFSDNFIKY